MNSAGLTKPNTAAITTAASTDLGTGCSAGISASSATSTSATDITVAHPERAPACIRMAERENDELVGNEPLKAEAILARPWPIKSWLSFQRLLSAWFSALALEAVSKKLIKAMMRAGITSVESVCSGGTCGQ